MALAYEDISIDQGCTFRLSWQVQDPSDPDKDWSGYTARGQVRETYGGILLATFTAAIDAVGVVTVSLTAAATTAFTWERGVFDVEIDGGVDGVTRVVEGAAELRPEVTV